MRNTSSSIKCVYLQSILILPQQQHSSLYFLQKKNNTNTYIFVLFSSDYFIKNIISWLDWDLIIVLLQMTFVIFQAAVTVVIVRQLDLQLPSQSVPITIKVASSNSAQGEVYSLQNYVIKFVSDLRLNGGFLMVLQFPPPIKLTATI